MGKTWDSWVPGPEVWRECFRVLKPGGHIVAFAGSRTHDLMSIALRLAGFECRDTVMEMYSTSAAARELIDSLDDGQREMLARAFPADVGVLWGYATGFPKSMNVSKAIDAAAGIKSDFVPVGNAVKRMIPGADQNATGSWIKDNGREYQPGKIVPVSDAARQWEGWGTMLKPAFEPALLFRKPLSEGTVAANVLAHGTGAMNIDGCRVPFEDDADESESKGKNQHADHSNGPQQNNVLGDMGQQARDNYDAEGRWPANVIHDGSDEVVALFPDSTGAGGSVPRTKVTGYGNRIGNGTSKYLAGERKKVASGSGSAARFFYAAKASKRDRNEGLERTYTWESADLNQETDALLSLLRGMCADTTRLLADREWSMMLCGKSTAAKFQKDLMCITSTVSRLITELTTWSFCPNSNTRESILAATRTLMASGSSLAESAEFISRLILDSTDEKTASVLGAVHAVLLKLSPISEHGRLGNVHSTVKPTDLMAYLCRLVTQPDGVVLDPFMGSGSTGKACMLEGFNFIGIEREAEYLEIARARIEHAKRVTEEAANDAQADEVQADLFGGVA